MSGSKTQFNTEVLAFSQRYMKGPRPDFHIIILALQKASAAFHHVNSEPLWLLPHLSLPTHSESEETASCLRLSTLLKSSAEHLLLP